MIDHHAGRRRVRSTANNPIKNTQINLNAMLTRVNNFGIAHAADFPATSKGGGLFASVAAGVPQTK